MVRTLQVLFNFTERFPVNIENIAKTQNTPNLGGHTRQKHKNCFTAVRVQQVAHTYCQILHSEGGFATHEKSGRKSETRC